MLAWHGNDTARPTAVDDAREAEELAAARARVTAARVDHARAVAARAVGRAAVGGPGHTAAREAAAAIAAAALARRTHTVTAETARHDAVVRDARGLT